MDQLRQPEKKGEDQVKEREGQVKEREGEGREGQVRRGRVRVKGVEGLGEGRGGVLLPGAPTPPDHAALLQCCCCTASAPAAPSETARDSHVKDHKIPAARRVHTRVQTHTHCSTWSLPYSVLGYPSNAVESVAREVQDPQSPVVLQSLDTLQLAAAQGELVNC